VGPVKWSIMYKDRRSSSGGIHSLTRFERGFIHSFSVNRTSKRFRQRQSVRIIIKRFRRCRSFFIKIQTISFRRGFLFSPKVIPNFPFFI